MGLEDFIEDDDDSSSSPTSSGNSGNSINHNDIGVGVNESDMQFYGHSNPVPDDTPMEREDAMSNYSMVDLASVKDGDIEFHSDHIKLYCPVFYIISSNPMYESGEMYQLKYTEDSPKPSWNGRVVTCIGGHNTRLGNMNKEVAMFNVGHTDKAKAMKELRDSLGEHVEEDTLVYVSFFGDAFMLRDLAQANHKFREGDLINRDKVMHNVMSARMLEARMDDG